MIDLGTAASPGMMIRDPGKRITRDPVDSHPGDSPRTGRRVPTTAFNARRDRARPLAPVDQYDIYGAVPSAVASRDGNVMMAHVHSGATIKDDACQRRVDFGDPGRHRPPGY